MNLRSCGLALALMVSPAPVLWSAQAPSAMAHGGAFPVPPPGDTAPGPASAPKYPGPGGPTPAGPTTGQGPASPSPPVPQPGAPLGGTGPNTPGTPSPGTPKAPTTPAGNLVNSDLSSWAIWWYFNREELLDLRRRFRETGQATGQVAPKDIPSRPSDRALENTVLPALFSLTDEKEQDNMRLSAAIALARIATPMDERVLETLGALVREKDPTLREGAALALGIDGDPRTIDSLAAILGGDKPAKQLLGKLPNDRLRAFAAYGLALVADRAANDDIRRVVLRPVLEHFLDTKERSDLRVALTLALGMMRIEFGEPEPELDRKASAPFPRYRRQLIDVLFGAYAEERDPLVRAHLPVTLARLLKDAPDDVRDAGIARLLAALDDEPKTLELDGLIIGLGILGDSWGRPSSRDLRAALYAQASTQRESHARHLALIALSEVVANSGPAPPPAVVQAELEDFFLATLENGRRADRPWVALAAGSFGARLRMPLLGRSKGHVGAAVVEELRKIVRGGGSPEELSAAVLALGLIEDQTAAEDVERLLDKSGNKEVRAYTALSLGLMRRTNEVAKLEGLLEDLRYDPVALENAAIGLALLDRTRSSVLLRERLATASNGTLAAPLASALGRVSDSASVLPLAQMSLDERHTLTAREHASIALGLIADRDDLSWRSRLAQDVNFAAWTPTLFDTAGQGVLNIF